MFSKMTVVQRLLLLALLWFLFFGGPAVSTKLTAVTYFYEKDVTGAVPAQVLSAISALNLKGILATNLDVGATDGTNEVADQYKVSLPAAKAAGLPAMVFVSGEKVVKILKDPKTEQEVLSVVK